MGFDIGKFDALIQNLGTSSAAMQKDTTKTYASGWDAIQAKAKSEGAADTDLTSLEGSMKSELASLMGAELGNTAGVKQNQEAVFSEEDISLENMMTELKDVDGIDLDKLREYNKIPLTANPADIDELTEAGFDPELLEILTEETPGVISYVTNAIKDGSANRIQAKTDELNQYGSDADIAGFLDFFGKDIQRA